MVNAFARYVGNRMIVFGDELPTLMPFESGEIDAALSSGYVRKVPISVYRNDGCIYWTHDIFNILSLAMTAGELAKRQCIERKSPLVGTIGNVKSNDELFSDSRSATVALVYGREAGLFEEHEFGGMSVFFLGKKYCDLIKL